MKQNTLTPAIALVAGTTLITACGGGSSSSGSEDEIETPVVQVAEYYSDPAWSAGADTLVGLTYPQGAVGGSLVALKRSADSEENISHTLMLADSSSKEFQAVEGVTLAKPYYRDLLALPVTTTVEGEERTVALVATCGYEEASMIEGGEIPMRGEVGPRAVAIAEEPQTPASLEIYLTGTGISESLDISTGGEGGALVDCHSLGGLSASDLSSKGTSAYEVDFFITGKDSTGEVAVFEASMIYNYENNEVTESDFTVLDTDADIIVSAVEEDPEDDFLVAMTIEENTYLLNGFGSESNIELYNEGNPFTSGTEDGALILDLVYSGDNLLAVSEDAGLAGADFTGGEFVALSGGDFTRCVDQLAVNGTTVWCHDSTEEGTLIEFTAPTVPQTESESQSLAAAARGGSKEEAEQIKAELEGAGAEVEVK